MADVHVPPVELDEEMSMMDFEDLLESYDYDRPRHGEILKGVILEITNDEVIVDLGGKHDAFVTRRDLDRLDNEILGDLEKGSELNVYVLRPRGDDGEVLVSINKALTVEDWEYAAELMDKDEKIEVTISGYNKGGALVDFGRLRGFIPNSQIVEVPRGASREEQDNIKAEMIGQSLPVKVIEVNQRRNRLVLSETAARRDQRQDILEALEVGQVISGRVVKIVEYGAFVDIGGVNGLVHISKLDWRHVNHPSDVLTVGEEIDVRIEDVDIERERISLNRQALIPDPWGSIEETYQVGDLETGRISSVVDYGAFVELPNGVTGLIHVSEMSSYNISSPQQWAQEGEELLVRIISIEPDRKRIGLSVDRVSQEELYDWMTARGETTDGMNEEPVEEMDELEAEPEPEYS
jgi:small subunit ribosomal protein S1